MYSKADSALLIRPTLLSRRYTDTFVYSVQPYNQNNGSPPPLFNNRTASPLYNLGLTYNASYGSGNGLSNTVGSSLLSNVQLSGTDLSVTNLTFADLYTTTNGVGASGLLGLGFPLNGNIWSVSGLSQASIYSPIFGNIDLTGQHYSLNLVSLILGCDNWLVPTNKTNSLTSNIIILLSNSTIITNTKSNNIINF